MESILKRFLRKQKKYIETRLKPATQRLYTKANNHIIQYYILQFIIIIAGALIPIVNTFPFEYTTSLNETLDNTKIRIISAVLGGIVVVFTATLQLTKLRESVTIFRIIASRLQREYHSFLQGIGDYSTNDSVRQEKIFKQNSESLIFNATTEYYDLFRDLKKEGQLNDNKTNNQ